MRLGEKNACGTDKVGLEVVSTGDVEGKQDFKWIKQGLMEIIQNESPR